MKQEVLALVGCLAATASTSSVADVLPEKLVGLNLGEIRSSSFLNQPFKGVIPFLFTSHEKSKTLDVRLAPQSVFNSVGAEKHPILNNLNFQITKQNNKPVILISSDQPINLPFLNFILEIKSPNSVVYQDYTVLLDPQTQKQTTTSNVTYVDTQQVTAEAINTKSNSLSDEDLLRKDGALLLANLSSEVITKSQNLQYRVKSGDSLLKIAQRQNIQNASLKKVSGLIFKKNPKAFIRGNVNRLKKGAILILPTSSEVNGFEIAQNKKVESKRPQSKKETKSTTSSIVKTYTVLKGDSLSKISNKFRHKDMSFTHMMNEIYDNNPTAFIDGNRNKIKAGIRLNIPSSEKTLVAIKETSEKNEVSINNSKVSKKTQTTYTKQKANQYKVKKGDTLSYITNKIGHKEVPFAKMLKAIHAHNPDSFVDGKMANLVEGSVIMLPPISSIESNRSKVGVKKRKLQTTKIQKKMPTSTEEVAADNKSINLTKRIRELRKELQQAKENLSDLKGNLSNKETLLEQKNMQLDSLNTLLTKFNKSKDPAVLIPTTIKPSSEIKTIKNDGYVPKSKAEMAKLVREQLNRKTNTKERIEKIKKLQTETFSPKKSLYTDEKGGLFKNYKESSLLNLTNTNYAYLTMALLLSLLLIRYRRELYAYTYSSINYDQPKYYPIPDADTYDLKEQNINYHDAQMDEDPSNYELLPKEQMKESISISPHLVEATENIFQDNEEAMQIEHCEHLVTELFDDLSQNKEQIQDNDWENIEKVCDTYIEKIKDTEVSEKANEDGNLPTDATDFNHMMSDLLESLDKVDKSVKKNNLKDEDFPNIVNSSLIDSEDFHDRI